VFASSTERCTKETMNKIHNLHLQVFSPIWRSVKRMKKLFKPVRIVQWNVFNNQAAHFLNGQHSIQRIRLFKFV
jgi:hypothetical protein